MILIAEDNLIMQDLLVEQLTVLGREAFAVGNGQDALDRVKADKFSLILMDVGMPIMDGFEATKAIRKAEKELGRDRTPIIAVTGQTDRATCLRHDMDDAVIKPVLLDDLRVILQRWLPTSA